MKLHTRIFNLYRELRRRKVFQVASVYLVTAWGLSLGAAELLPTFGIPDSGVRWFVIVAAAGFPVAVVLAWVYELSGGAINLETPALDEESLRTTHVAGGVSRLLVRWQDVQGEHQESFTGGFIIGREQGSSVRVQDPLVSRQHARVFFRHGKWQIEDLGSRNGTRVNGELVTTADLPPRCDILLHPEGEPVHIEVVDRAPKTVAYMQTGSG